MEILTVHPLVAGNSRDLVKKLLAMTEIAAGLQLIDHNKHSIDDYFFETLMEESQDAESQWLTGAEKAHRLAVWRLHAASRYYYVTIRRGTPPSYRDEILGYSGDETATAEALMLLADVFETVLQLQYDTSITLCTDAFRLYSDPTKKAEVALRKARLLRKVGRSSEAVACVQDVRQSLRGSIPRASLSDFVYEQAYAHIVQREYDEAIHVAKAFQSSIESIDETGNWLVPFELETSLVRQFREIADGILADMVLNPAYYEGVWSNYGPATIWWSYFSDCYDIAPELEPEQMETECKQFEEQFIKRVASGDIVPYSPEDILAKEVDVSGTSIKFVHFEEINQHLREIGSEKRLVVQDMRTHPSSQQQPICEFIFGNINVTEEFQDRDFYGQKRRLLQFGFDYEDVVCPTMTLEIGGLNGHDAFDNWWIVVRMKKARQETYKTMRLLAAFEHSKPSDAIDEVDNE